MNAMKRFVRWLAALVLASVVGAIPACGGGGMKYLIEPPAALVQSAWL